MSEYPLPVKSLWQPPLGWLGASVLAGLCLLLLCQQVPPIYRRSLRNARWLVIPYLGLITGGISPRLLGITGINWFASFGFGLVLIGGMLVVLVIIRSVIAFSVTATALATAPVAVSPATRPHPPPLLPGTARQQRYATSLTHSFFNLGAEEFHLAFLRSALWELLLTTSPAITQAGYWAAWVALALALPETLYYQTTFAQRFCKGALLVATTVLFIFTRNFWLSWLLHLLGWLVLAPSAFRDKP